MDSKDIAKYDELITMGCDFTAEEVDTLLTEIKWLRGEHEQAPAVIKLVKKQLTIMPLAAAGPVQRLVHLSKALVNLARTAENENKELNKELKAQGPLVPDACKSLAEKVEMLGRAVEMLIQLLVRIAPQNAITVVTASDKADPKPLTLKSGNVFVEILKLFEDADMPEAISEETFQAYLTALQAASDSPTGFHANLDDWHKAQKALSDKTGTITGLKGGAYYKTTFKPTSELGKIKREDLDNISTVSSVNALNRVSKRYTTLAPHGGYPSPMRSTAAGIEPPFQKTFNQRCSEVAIQPRISAQVECPDGKFLVVTGKEKPQSFRQGQLVKATRKIITSTSVDYSFNHAHKGDLGTITSLSGRYPLVRFHKTDTTVPVSPDEIKAA